MNAEHNGLKIVTDGAVLFTADAGRDVLVVQVNTFKKRRSLDIRRYWNNGKGELAPSPKGVAIAEESVPAFLAKLADAGLTSTSDAAAVTEIFNQLEA